MNLGMPVCVLSFLLPSFILRFMDRTHGWFKYLIIKYYIFGITVLYVAIPRHTLLAWIAPVLLSCHYYSRKADHQCPGILSYLHVRLRHGRDVRGGGGSQLN